MPGKEAAISAIPIIIASPELMKAFREKEAACSFGNGEIDRMPPAHLNMAEATKMKAPEIIELQRIRLRRPAVSDAEAIFEYGSDPEVGRYADWPIRKSIDGLAESLAGRAARWDSGTDLYWIITLPGEDRAIGGISCVIAGDSAEVGFLLHRRHWGKGFATEAATAVIEWALSLPSIQKVWATCDAENLASVRVLEKAGLTRDAILPRSVVRPNISTEPRDAFLYSRTGRQP